MYEHEYMYVPLSGGNDDEIKVLYPLDMNMEIIINLFFEVMYGIMKLVLVL